MKKMYTPETILSICIVALAGTAYSGGELSHGQAAGRTAPSPEVVEMRQHIAGLQAGLNKVELEAALAAQQALDARKKKVMAVRPVQDKYGDPMYAFYGPMVPEPGTPEYNGPRYAASFDRGYLDPVHDGKYRGYARGRYSHPGFISHTDVIMGVSANNSYMQHGMQVAPGSMYPSAARVIINNP